MKCLIMADIHFYSKDLREKVAAFNGAMEYALTNGYDSVIIAGDLYHVRNAVHTKVKTVVEELFDKWGSKGLKFYIDTGNHDLFSFNARDVTSLNSLKYIKNVHIFDGDGGMADISGESVYFIPYENDLDKFKAAFYNASKLNPYAIVIHQGVDEAKSPGQPDSGLNTAFFKSCFEGRVWCGDYHKKLNLGNFLSPGCLIQDDFGDGFEDKGFWTYDDGVLEFHKANYPEFMKIEIDSMNEIKGKKFKDMHMWFVTGNNKIVNKLYERCDRDGAVSCKVSKTKEFTSSHEHVIEIGGQSQMFEECIKIRKPRTGELQAELFDRICVKHETYADTIGSEFRMMDFLTDVAEVSVNVDKAFESEKSDTVLNDINNW